VTGAPKTVMRFRFLQKSSIYFSELDPFVGAGEPLVSYVAWATHIRPGHPTANPALESRPVSQRTRAMRKASARHILVTDQATCNDLKTRIEGGEDFAQVAREHSTCPSGKEGGDLGEFSPGMMVKEFDTVVFSADVGKVHGPVKTQFGYHLIEITRRSA
jgi:peptidyl-prolyl cis-trans isomerase C